MQILFFIGNGFDRNLGLRTSYKDFYPYYTKRFPDDNLAKSIAGDYERWSDLELGLGSYLSKIRKSEMHVFYEEKNNIEISLTDYLNNEKNRLSYNAGLKEEFLRKLQSFPKQLSKKDEKDMYKWIGSINAPIHYGFISFNYTNILSQIIDLQYKGSSVLTHVSNNLNYTDLVDKPIYIHGSLEDRIILAVNDKTQIKNDDIANDPIESGFMIKNELNSQIGELRWEDTKTKIDASHYIIVYGMSLGDTDRYYWQYLYEWLLKRNSVHKLILCRHNSRNVKLSATDFARHQQMFRNKFIRAAGIENVDETVFKDIIVVNNPTVFDFTNISLNDEAN